MSTNDKTTAKTEVAPKANAIAPTDKKDLSPVNPNTKAVTAVQQPAETNDEKTDAKQATPEADTNTDAPKKPTKADNAKVIYDQMVADPKNTKSAIIAKMKKEAGLTTAGANTYFYKFQRESGKTAEKQPSKMDKAKVIYEQLTTEGKGRKEIIDAFIKEVGLTKAGAPTYYQTIKKAHEESDKPAE
ncbi:hypothetical protein [Methylomonas sp. TEB]|uniref:hypothetical protein n=1 Tax=Methylomonas sp. TEB TaxID=3398229 RepID=UPI0039F5D4FB